MSDEDNIADPGLETTKVTTTFDQPITLQDSTPQGNWVTRDVASSVTDAMDRAPVGALYDIVYASLANRLRTLLDQQGDSLLGSAVHTAINFRSLNPNFYAGGNRHPTTPANAGAGVGSYHSSVWGNNKDERLPQTLPRETAAQSYASGQDPTPKQNAGVLVAKLFQDLESHLPLVLFNVASKEYVPVGIGGSSTSRRFYKDGKVVTETAYKRNLTVDASVFTADESSTAQFQAIVESAFDTLRDHVGSGSVITGSSWQLTMPTTLDTSTISDFDPPWAGGDEKGAKLYTANVTLNNMSFEAINYIGKAITAQMSTDVITPVETSIAIQGGSTDASEPIELVLGKTQRLIVNGAPLDADILVSQGHSIIEIRKPNRGAGFFEIIPRRTGEATLTLYSTGMVIDISSPSVPAGRVGEPLLQRKVVVSAV